MYRIFIFIFLAILCAFTIEETIQYRHNIKHLTDEDADKVNLEPKKATILQLSASTKPSSIHNLMPRTRMEFVTFKINCLVKSVESDNNEIRLVLCDPSDTTLTMVAEIPNMGFDSVITQIHQYMIPASKMKEGGMKKGKYQIVGVGFYNVPNSINGLPKNGLGICPVLGITKL